MQAAMKIVQRDAPLRNFYTRIRKRSSAKIARVAESLTVPMEDRLGLDDGERFAPVPPDSGENDSYEASRFFRRIRTRARAAPDRV